MNIQIQIYPQRVAIQLLLFCFLNNITPFHHSSELHGPIQGLWWWWWWTKGKAVSEDGDQNLQELDICISILLDSYRDAMIH